MMQEISENNEIYKKNCKMHLLKNAYKTKCIEVYECKNCKMENICDQCYENCHKPCNGSNSNQNEKKLLLEFFKCDCHNKNHKIVEIISKEDQKNLNLRLVDYINLVDIYCRYLCEVCYKNTAIKINNFITYEETIGDNIICSGTNHNDDNIFNFILEKKAFPKDNTFYNYLLLTRTNFFREIIQAQKDFLIGKKDAISARSYLNSLDNFKKIKNSMPVSCKLKKDKIILKILQKEFIFQLFENDENKHDYNYLQKIYTLQVFIDFFIKPVSEVKFKKIITQGYINTSPLHRLIFKSNVNEFFKELEIDQKKYMKLLKNVFNSVKTCLDPVNIQQLELDPTLLFFQYYRLVKYLLSYQHYTLEIINTISEHIVELKGKINDEILDKKNSTDEKEKSNKNSKIYSNKMKQILSKIVKIIFISINDYESINCVIRNTGKNNENYVFNHSEYKKLVKLLFSIRTEEGLGINKFNQDYTVELVDMLSVQNNEKNDDYIESTISIFESKKLYIFSDDINHLTGMECSACISNDVHINNFSYEDKEITNFKEIVKKCLEAHTKLFENDLSNKFDFVMKFNKLKNHTDYLLNQISDSLNLCEKKKKIFKQLWMFKNGIFNNIMEMIFYLKSVASIYEMKFVTDKTPDKNPIVDIIIQNIIKILHKLVEDNSFLSALLFNDKAIKIFELPILFSSKILKENFLQTLKEFGLFILSILKKAVKDNYKINFLPFIYYCSNDNKLNYNLCLDESEPSKILWENSIKLQIYDKMLRAASKNSFEYTHHFVYNQLVQKMNFITKYYNAFCDQLLEMNTEQTAKDKIVNTQRSNIFLLIKLFSKVVSNLTPYYSLLLIQQMKDFDLEKIFIYKQNILDNKFETDTNPNGYSIENDLVPIEQINNNIKTKTPVYRCDNSNNKVVTENDVYRHIKPKDFIYITKLYLILRVKFPFKIYDLSNYENLKDDFYPYTGYKDLNYEINLLNDIYVNKVDLIIKNNTNKKCHQNSKDSNQNSLENLDKTERENINENNEKHHNENNEQLNYKNNYENHEEHNNENNQQLNNENMNNSNKISNKTSEITNFGIEFDLYLEFIIQFPKYFNDHETEFENLHMLIKFFLETIAKPIVDFLYVLIYFNGEEPDPSHDRKYYIYMCVFLFLQSFSKVLNVFTDTIMSRRQKIEENTKFLLKGFLNLDIKNDCDDNIIVGLQKVIKELNGDIDNFTNGHINYYKPVEMIDIFKKFISKLNFKNDREFESRKLDQLYTKIEEWINHYKKEKEKDTENLIIRILKSSSDELFKKNIFIFVFIAFSQNESNIKSIDPTPNNNLYPKLPGNNIESKCIIQAINSYKEVFETPKKLFLLQFISKIFLLDIPFYQNLYLEISNLYSDKPLGVECLKLIPRIVIYTQFLFIEYSNLFPNKDNLFIRNLETYIEFATILCKGLQNDFFVKYITFYPTKLSDNEDNHLEFSQKFSYLIIVTVIKIIKHYDLYHKSKYDVIKIITDKQIDLLNIKNNFLKTIFIKYIELLKTLSQSENTGTLLNCYYYYTTDINYVNIFNRVIVNSCLDILLKKLDSNCKIEDEEYDYFFFLSHFFDFINILINNDIESGMKFDVIEPTKMLNIFSITYDYVVKNYIKLGSSENIYPEEKSVYESNVLIESVRNSKSSMEDDKYLKLFLKIYMYFVQCSEKDSKYKRLLKKGYKGIDETTITSIKEKKEYNILKFFEHFIKSVELRIKFDKTEKKNQMYGNMIKIMPKILRDMNFLDYSDKPEEIEDSTKWILYFEILPDGIYMSNEGISRCLENSEQSKKKFLDSYELSMADLEVRKAISKESTLFSRFLIKMNPENVLFYSILLSILTNIFMVISIFRINNDVYNPLSIWIQISSLVHLLYLFFCLFNFISLQIRRYRKLIEYKSNSNLKNIMTYVKMTPYSTFILLWNFLIGLIATLNSSLCFLFALQMFSIFTLFDTMMNVLIAVKLKYEQFLSTGVLILILTQFYSIISIFYFKDNYQDSDLNENSCSSLLHCFLFFIANGIRTGSGFGFPVLPIGQQGYWIEFGLDWLFYFTIILILLNIINGVIVDTFQSLRTSNDELKEQKFNTCFICSGRKTKFEAKGIDFSDHIKRDHNMKNYYQFFYRIKKSDESQLNFIELFIRNKINKNSTDFFPCYSNLSISNQE